MHEILNSPSLEEMRRICEEFLPGDIDWSEDGSQGFLTCPYVEGHRKDKPPGRRETVLYLGRGYPHIKCFHESCQGGERLGAINQLLRDQCSIPDLPPDPGRVKARKQAKELSFLLPRILEEYGPRATPLTYPALTSKDFLIRFFDPGDVIWLGSDCRNTGERWKKSFRAVEQWAALPFPIDSLSYLCPNPITPGKYDRNDANVIQPRKYLVLESDVLGLQDLDEMNRNPEGEPWLNQRAVIEYIKRTMPLHLQALVFTGHKSVHSWWIHPGFDWVSKHKPQLMSLGFDPGTLSPQQPVRLPGAINGKTGKIQSLLWARDKS
jgi:hypothetical protein